ncbi:hypothetical protein DL237_14395 [Pseudooceanicola sediminis]|uniref:Uncharacterized protein n=1 Tax=Pseudooceanicola sediminis TaxID=2211117 RepID=A0A399J0E7_9RHOB|nr:hypothetical protein [Pseudooceanicola sediminis]KAA2312109.1 hypothetical protein E0K93_18775 [Puniceibacterium sp. HSS470]RII38117.1 hypothetical protein DL237_14395 [Pseudooceanicola sediminis]|tara:strand:- start:230 stop:550 length:321 start_codon:yes stop_codon:yes gene_type:complete
MFTFILETLKDQGRGIHAYRSAAKSLFEKAAESPDNAAAFYILATSADTFVDRHERMPMSAHELEQTFDAFQADIMALQSAHDSDDAQAILATLNRIANARAVADV